METLKIEKPLYPNAIAQTIKGLAHYEMLELITIYCNVFDYPDNHIYYMEDFDDLMTGRTATEIIRDISHDFNISHNFFYVNGYGHFCSTNFIDSDFLPDTIETASQNIYDRFEEFEEFFCPSLVFRILFNR